MPTKSDVTLQPPLMMSWGKGALWKGNGNTESCHRHEDFEISVARDEGCVMIEAALSDERIGKIRSSAASKHLGPEKSGSLPKAFGNEKGRKFKYRLF